MTTMTEQEQIRVLREALEDMGDPIAAMKREVPEGSVLNPHMAVQMAGDPEWYKRRAREALAATATIQPVAAPEPVEPYGYHYEWAGCITTDGPQHFKWEFGKEHPPEWAVAEGQARGVTPLYTAAPAQPAPDPDELQFNAQRLRNVAKLVGLESAVPQDDATLDGARGAVLGMIAAKLRERNSAAPAQAATDDVRDAYRELIYAVARKFPDETRHQTALRYIRERETPSTSTAAQAATPADSQKGSGGDAAY